MGLLRRTELLLNAKVDFHPIIAEPATSALHQVRGLWMLSQLQNVSIEMAGTVFPTWRHGELNMINPNNRHL